MHKIPNSTRKYPAAALVALGLVISSFLIIAASLNIVSATTSKNVIASTTNSNTQSIKNILLINSYDQAYIWTANITKAVTDKLNASGLKYDLQIENIDTKRINDSVYQQLVFNTYKYKFSKFKYDIVLTSDDDALDFALKHRDDLFPKVPVVFCGAKYLQTRLDILKGQKSITGVNADSDIEASVNIGLKLQSNIKNIYFIHDNTTMGNIVGAYINTLIPKYKDKYKVTVYDGTLSEVEIINNLKQAPSNSLILLVPFLYDEKDNKYLNYRDLLQEIHTATNIPIYGIYDFNLGDGIVGGKLTSSSAQGGSMADMAIRVLKGEDINKIPILIKSPNVYSFDYNELIAHNSIMSNIPAGSLIINQPESFYSKYKEYIWIGVSAGIILIGIIAILAYITYLKQSKIIQQEEVHKKLKNDITKSHNTLRVETNKLRNLELELGKKEKDINNLTKIAADNATKVIELQESIKHNN